VVGIVEPDADHQVLVEVVDEVADVDRSPVRHEHRRAFFSEWSVSQQLHVRQCGRDSAAAAYHGAGRRLLFR
jgi:hypothetical protein